MDDLDLALDHIARCAMVDKPCAALLDELRRLYRAAGEPLPSVIRPTLSSSILGHDGLTYTIATDTELLRDL